MPNAREPAVAGSFYPVDPHSLRQQVDGFLALAKSNLATPKAIIAPHAGYIYSGPIAASAYAPIAALKDQIRRVILLGPAHRVYVKGLAVSSASVFNTPLGSIPIDRDAVDDLVNTLDNVSLSDAAHEQEHSLEVHLPFLQQVLDKFYLVPLVVGEVSTNDVATVLDRLWGGPETLIVISSDLSHYHDYDTARSMDRATATAIENMDPNTLNQEQACGQIPVCGLLIAAKARGLKAQTVDLRNSGDTAGPHNQVVGYGAWLFS
ncbi:MAG TPA: AmmeMemoRadiSam system protein B [Acidiferrobacteraceae bacterium]|nr:AmmeMemoRadiSam system protein B [Acidiferrobacteraceae bacterium]